MNIKYYCIALPERYNIIKKFQETISFTLVEAVNGLSFTKEYIQRLIQDGILLPDGEDKHVIGRNLSVGNVGCVLSHICVALKILDQEEKYAVVLEDDIELLPEFVEKIVSLLSDCEEQNIEFDMIRLHVMEPQRQFLPPGFQGLMPIPPGFWGTGAYILQKNSAKKLLESLHPIISTVDIQLSYSQLKQYIIIGTEFIKDIEIPSFTNTVATKYIKDFL